MPTAARACSSPDASACCSSCTTRRSASCAMRCYGPTRSTARAHRREPRAPDPRRGTARSRPRGHAAEARRPPAGLIRVAPATAVIAADDGHRVPLVVARDHHGRPMMTDHDAKQATHERICPNCIRCPSARSRKPLEWGRKSGIPSGAADEGLTPRALRSRGAHGSHHGRFERHRPGRRARTAAARRLAADPRGAPRGTRAAAAAELSATALRCDVTETATSPALVAAAQAAGGCDLLVHSAAPRPAPAVLEAGPRRLPQSFEVNYIGLVRVATAFWPLLEASRGRLVPVVSVAGIGRPRALGAVRGRQERGALVGALLRRRCARARRRRHDRQPRPGADARLPAGRAAAQPLGPAAHGRRRALCGAPAGSRRPPCAEVPYRSGGASPRRAGSGAGLTARVAARAWRAHPRVAPRPRPHEPARRARHRRQLGHRPRHRPPPARARLPGRAHRARPRSPRPARPASSA